MKRFYLTGHNNLSNRGCEAIVRGTVKLLRQEFGDIEVLVPSTDIESDQAQWPRADECGVRFLPAFAPAYTRYWVHFQRLPFAILKRSGWPFPVPKELRNTFTSVDAGLSVGGDNYSLDYRLPSLLMGIDKAAMDAGKPVILWGASVGPFEREPHFLPKIRKHLEGFSFIAARESVTIEYLKNNLGLTNVYHVADPAFAMDPEPVQINDFWPSEGRSGVLGLNVSPLLLRYRPTNEPPMVLINEVATFVRHVVEDLDMGVLLVPHVISTDKKNNDAIFMKNILNHTGDFGGMVKIMNSKLNAVQIKYIINRCKFFIGARTHSTIAALSSAVPTISIAYSIKAKGINKDLFGHTDYVLETDKVSSTSLKKAMEYLIINDESVRHLLSAEKKEWQKKAMISATRLRELIK